MAHIPGFERDQLLLLPEAVDDDVGPDNPVRFIDAFVDGLDLVEAGFGRVQPKATGRLGYAPGDLLKLYIYGYLNRVRSSRRLEAECHRNIEVIWLLRTLKPDFKTIADFRADNRAAFKSVFRQFTLLCKRLDLFGRELLAVDGTRIKAVNNKDRNFTRNSLEKFIKAADERLADCLQRLDEGGAAEKATSGARVKNLAEKIEGLRKKRGQYDAMLKQLERTGEDQISLTDPDSRAMAAVIAVEHPVWQERPLLIVHPREGNAPSKEAILSFLAERLPKWQMPDDVVLVDGLPHTATGKLLKTDLRRRFHGHLAVSG